MKKIKYIKFIALIIAVFTLTGCLKRDELEDISIMTTSYPLEYVIKTLYGEHSIVNSVYPDDTDTFNYTLSSKQISDYSKKDLFIYNGLLAKDRSTTINFLDKNKSLLIIDSASGIETNWGVEEVWLNPSNLLMMAQNIRNGLEKYITNSYLIKNINTNYETLKVNLSELDAELKLTANNAVNNTIVVTSDSLKYLEKYGITVISLDSSKTPVSQRDIDTVKNLINTNRISYIFNVQFGLENELAKELIKNTLVKEVTFRRLDTITDAERSNNQNYLTLMNRNIELLKEELYK